MNVCMYVHHVQTWCRTRRSKEEVRFPAASHHLGAGNSCPLEEQKVLLTTEATLLPQCSKNKLKVEKDNNKTPKSVVTDL